jgi:hypothetical protein
MTIGSPPSMTRRDTETPVVPSFAGAFEIQLVRRWPVSSTVLSPQVTFTNAERTGPWDISRLGGTFTH